ncbi:DUF1707 SHOCT-like domain-containing protein [Brevibacterium litoralis]|uniref:DUF1707 SHOCT-like domain-containing protein n=1 Tax=Brevibacterium litoralis TaxID=3138935 RepID=UPI0032ED97D1
MALNPSHWDGFTADPHETPDLRASDADREVLFEVLGTAFSQGLLDVDEHAERMETAGSVRTLGQVLPLLQDIVAPPGTDTGTGTSAAFSGSHDLVRRATGPTTPAARRALRDLDELDGLPTDPEGIEDAALAHFKDRMRRSIGSAAVPIGITLAIWLVSVLASGSFIFFWPVFVILGFGSNVASTAFNRQSIITERRRLLTTRARAKLGDPEARAQVEAKPSLYSPEHLSSTRAQRRHRKRRR